MWNTHIASLPTSRHLPTPQQILSHRYKQLNSDCLIELAPRHADPMIGGGENGTEPAVRPKFLNVPVLIVERMSGSAISEGRGIRIRANDLVCESRRAPRQLRCA